MKEFVAASSRDILKLSKLECPSLATITSKVFHDEKLELVRSKLFYVIGFSQSKNKLIID